MLMLACLPVRVCLLLPQGIVKGLVDVVKTAQKEKVVRVGLLSLRNLLADGDAIMASDMVDAGLAKAVASRAMQVRARQGMCGVCKHVGCTGRRRQHASRELGWKAWSPVCLFFGGVQGRQCW